MTWRIYLLLTLLGLAVATVVAALQPSPGYMDADYYYAGGLQLASGHGFTEPYLWNYLDNPIGLPHPSNAYWMPFASLLAAAGAVLFGSASWITARAGFLLVAALIPPVTAALAWSYSSRRDLAITSGLLAVFPAFYLPFLPVTDTFGLYMLFGGSFLSRPQSKILHIKPFAPWFACRFDAPHSGRWLALVADGYAGQFFLSFPRPPIIAVSFIFPNSCFLLSRVTC